MLSEHDPDVSETQTHKLANAAPAGRGHPASGKLPALSARWEALRPGCEFHLLRYAQTPLYQAPLVAPQAILDLGCGGGRWPTACRQQFPGATVIGVDWKIPYLGMAETELGFHFQQADIFHPLPFADAAFDYVHIRFLSMVIPLARWLPLLRESLRLLKPQGWLEVQELGLPRISHATPWVSLARLGRAHSVELFPGTALEKWLAQVGGVNIASKELLMQRSPDSQASARMMIRDGIAVFEMAREALLEQQILTASAYEHEFRRMQSNLFVPNREDTLPIHTSVCQKAGTAFRGEHHDFLAIA